MSTVNVTADATKTPANERVRDSCETPSLLPAVRTCLGTSKTGDRCKSRVVSEDGYCNRHSPTRAVDPTAFGKLGGTRSGEVRHEQSKSVRDLLRDKVESAVETIWSAFESGLTSDDERVRIAAATAVLAEAYGRPPQAIIGDPDQPVAFVLDSLLARAREQA